MRIKTAFYTILFAIFLALNTFLYVYVINTIANVLNLTLWQYIVACILYLSNYMFLTLVGGEYLLKCIKK